MKKLGKLNLKSEKMLSHEELMSFRGGSGGCYLPPTGDMCEDCFNSASCACEASCGDGSCSVSACIYSQIEQCISILNC